MKIIMYIYKQAIGK